MKNSFGLFFNYANEALNRDLNVEARGQIRGTTNRRQRMLNADKCYRSEQAFSRINESVF